MIIPVSRESGSHWQGKVGEGISEEVIQRLELKVKKEPSMQSFWGEAEEI